MKQIKISVLKFDLPIVTPAFRCVIQVGKVADLPEVTPELIIIKDTELNQFSKTPAEDYLTDALKRQYNPLLEHKGLEIGEVIFKPAKLILDKSKLGHV